MSNKTSSISSDEASDVKYPLVKLLKTYIDEAIISAASLIVAEITLATTAEKILSNTLTVEAVTARSTQLANVAAIAGEATRVGIAEVSFTDSITAENDRTIAAEGILNMDLASEDIHATNTEIAIAESLTA